MRTRFLRLSAIVFVLSGATPAWPESGGGAISLEMRDRASEEIAQLHPDMVRRARAMGLPVLTTGTRRAGARLQYPLQFTPSARGFAEEALFNHVDLDPTAGLRDFACGARTYDGHNGTDIGLAPYQWDVMDRNEMRAIAAGPGVILEKRDGEFDRQCAPVGSPPANYVIVSHDNGLIGYYWHLKNGTVTPKAVGGRVALGEPLGFVGSSGFSTGPHLHFELRGAGNAVVDPYIGQCNRAPVRLAHQAAAIDTTVLRVATHRAPPPNAGNCDDPDPGYTTRFNPGQPVYGVVYLRDQKPGATVLMQFVRPDGSVAASWTTGSPGALLPFAYWWSSYTIPAGAPRGAWRLRATLAGRAFEELFWVGPTPPANTTITASVASPVRNVSPGTVADFIVTLRNTGTRDAVGCRLSLARPVHATIRFTEMAAGAQPNRAFTVPQNANRRARLTVIPRTGFKATAAEFGVIAKCFNSATAAFSRAATMLTLSGP